MSALQTHFITPEEYLAFERRALDKSEYYNGEMFAMAGASKEHNRIVANLVSRTDEKLRGGPCDVYPSDMRIKVPATGLYTYLDVSIVCGESEFEDAAVDVLLNPLVIFEVLSPSTENYDKGQKFDQYRQLRSFREYVLVAQDKFHVMHYRSSDDGQWTLRELRSPQDTLRLEFAACELPLAEIYFKVPLDQ